MVLTRSGATSSVPVAAKPKPQPTIKSKAKPKVEKPTTKQLKQEARSTWRDKRRVARKPEVLYKKGKESFERCSSERLRCD